MIPPPVLQALVVADQIYTDAATGKKIIAGVFNRLMASDFPATFSTQTWAYISVTNIHGPVEFVVRYVDLNDGKMLMEASPIRATCDDPLRSIEITLPVPPFPMPHEGSYAFEVYAGEERLGALRITVSRME